MKGRLLFLVALLIHQTAPIGLTQLIHQTAPIGPTPFPPTVDPGNLIYGPAKNFRIHLDAMQMAFRNECYDEAISQCTALLQLQPSNQASSYFYSQRSTAYRHTNQIPEAMSDAESAIHADPTSSYGYLARAHINLQKRNYKAAFADLEATLAREEAETKPDYQMDLNSLAWNLATCPDAAYRNGRRAVELSKKACDLSRWQSPQTIDTLAAAYAECGDFDQAIKYQTQAMSIVDHPGPAMTEKEKTLAMQQLREHLVLYKNHNPCRDDHLPRLSQFP